MFCQDKNQQNPSHISYSEEGEKLNIGYQMQTLGRFVPTQDREHRTIYISSEKQSCVLVL